MIIGSICVELFIPGSNSLKTKRYAVRSIKDRLKNKFNVSVAEVDNCDKWQRCSLAVVTVTNETKHLESILNNVMNLIYGDHRVEVIDSHTTYY